MFWRYGCHDERIKHSWQRGKEWERARLCWWSRINFHEHESRAEIRWDGVRGLREETEERGEKKRRSRGDVDVFSFSLRPRSLRLRGAACLSNRLPCFLFLGLFLVSFNAAELFSEQLHSVKIKKVRKNNNKKKKTTNNTRLRSKHLSQCIKWLREIRPVIDDTSPAWNRYGLVCFFSAVSGRRLFKIILL